MKINQVLVIGHFNVLHPGHIRLFKFARDCGDQLLVAVESDRLAGAAAHVREELRLEGVKSCALVDHAFIFDEPVVRMIGRIRPAVVVKGKEHENGFNPEAEVIKTYGGKLLFSSGEIQFCSADLLQNELNQTSAPSFNLPHAFMSRRNVSLSDLRTLVGDFSKLRVLTIGDLIVDDYIDCDPLGMSQEDPTVVFSKKGQRRFVGGAGIVAAHAAGLGAKSNLICVVGNDSAREFAAEELVKANVNAFLFEDSARPTTVKERYRSSGKTLFRVSHLHQSAISLELQSRIIDHVRTLIRNTDLLIFSDFNYGVLTQPVVEEVIVFAKANGTFIAADSQSSSQMGDIGRYKNIDLLLPTEREARVSTQNREDGIVVLAEQLRRKSGAKYILLKMGEDGVLIHAPGEAQDDWLTDRVEALNKFPKDVAGAGDSMLVASALALAVGGDIWQSACVASIAASVQVGRVGNVPIEVNDLLARLSL